MVYRITHLFFGAQSTQPELNSLDLETRPSTFSLIGWRGGDSTAMMLWDDIGKGDGVRAIRLADDEFENCDYRICRGVGSTQQMRRQRNKSKIQN